MTIKKFKHKTSIKTQSKVINHRQKSSKVINQRQVTCWYHLILLVGLVDQVAFVCCLHKSHIHLSWGEIWINFDACHVFGEISINVSALFFSVFIVFHHDTQTYDFILWITWRIYDNKNKSWIERRKMLPLVAMYENQVMPKGIKTIIQY